MFYAYLFEAKHIQGFLLSGGKLKDMIGASELVAKLCPDHVELVLDRLSVQWREKIEFSRNAGGAFYAFSEDGALLKAFQALWSIVVVQVAPGLSFVQALEPGETPLEAFDNARNALRLEERQPHYDPVRGNPFVRRNPRSGTPAVKLHTEHGDAIPLDLGQLRKRGIIHSRDVVGRFSSSVDNEAWPTAVEPDTFPFLEGQNHIAIIHADGNGLGSILRRLRQQVEHNPQGFLEIYRDFSTTVQEATQAAAERATETVLLPHRSENGLIPARPLILGGDDLLILVRSDLAIPYTEAFLEAFATFSGERIAAFSERYKLKQMPVRLTACAGIVFARYSQPFSMLHHLAEALCGEVKKTLKSRLEEGEEVPSAFAFHRVTGTSYRDWDQVVERDLVTTHNNRRYQHALDFYTIDATEGYPALSNLIALDSALREIPGGHAAMREYLGTLYQDTDKAAFIYRRWRRHTARDCAQALQGFDEGLRSLLGAELLEGHPYGAGPNTGETTTYRSPLADLITLHHMQSNLSHEVRRS